MKRKLVKNVRKLRAIIEKNRLDITRIVMSNDFLEKISQVPKEIEVDSVKEKDTEAEILRLFKIETILSEFVREGCILEMSNGNYYLIKV